MEKYWKAGPGSVCMKCCEIGHERQGNCGNRPEKCIMCAGEHQASEHQCRVEGYKIGKGKLCVHVKARYANCQGNHQANLTRCPARHKAEIHVYKKKRIEHGSNPETSPGIDTPNLNSNVKIKEKPA